MVSGSVIVTVVPTPRWLRTAIVPPFSSMLRLAIVSPSPVPVALVEKYGSKILRERFRLHADAGVGDLDDDRLSRPLADDSSTRLAIVEPCRRPASRAARSR